MSTVCLQGTVTGRVQGVFFRAETRNKALELGVGGWVRNREDGSVELLICGAQTQVDAMRRWLANGPPMARVDQVSLQPVSSEPAMEFRIID
ncbi:MAG: acylphosphatase [Pseudohongiellaceae bacterium]